MDVIIREVRSQDASQLLTVLKQMDQESDYMILDEHIYERTTDQLTHYLTQLITSSHYLLLVACYQDQLIGVASVKGFDEPALAHIGEVGIGLLAEFQHMGLGTALLEEVLIWAEEMGTIKRLELRVHVDNLPAIKLYQKIGFKSEARLTYGMGMKNGELADVWQMSYLLA